MTHADIGANLTDSMFQGEYHGKSYHAPDLDAVLQRAWAAGAVCRCTRPMLHIYGAMHDA